MAAGSEPKGTVTVPITTLDKVLIEAGSPTNFDFMSVDVEGHEIEVLKGFNFEYWKPRLILVEDHIENLEKLCFMTRSGYRLIRHTHYNGWYVPCDSETTINWSDARYIIRKYIINLPFRAIRNAFRRNRRRLKHQIA